MARRPSARGRPRLLLQSHRPLLPRPLLPRPLLSPRYTLCSSSRPHLLLLLQPLLLLLPLLWLLLPPLQRNARRAHVHRCLTQNAQTRSCATLRVRAGAHGLAHHTQRWRRHTRSRGQAGPTQIPRRHTQRRARIRSQLCSRVRNGKSPPPSPHPSHGTTHAHETHTRTTHTSSHECTSTLSRVTSNGGTWVANYAAPHEPT